VVRGPRIDLLVFRSFSFLSLLLLMAWSESERVRCFRVDLEDDLLSMDLEPLFFFLGLVDGAAVDVVRVVAAPRTAAVVAMVVWSLLFATGVRSPEDADNPTRCSLVTVNWSSSGPSLMGATLVAALIGCSEVDVTVVVVRLERIDLVCRSSMGARGWSSARSQRSD